MRKIECKGCGKIFLPTAPNGCYCSPECRHEAKKLKYRQYYRKKRTPKNNLNDIAKEALSKGISYGKYVALLESGKKCNT